MVFDHRLHYLSKKLLTIAVDTLMKDCVLELEDGKVVYSASLLGMAGWPVNNTIPHLSNIARKCWIPRHRDGGQCPIYVYEHALSARSGAKMRSPTFHKIRPLLHLLRAATTKSHRIIYQSYKVSLQDWLQSLFVLRETVTGSYEKLFIHPQWNRFCKHGAVSFLQFQVDSKYILIPDSYGGSLTMPGDIWRGKYRCQHWSQATILYPFYLLSIINIIKTVFRYDLSWIILSTVHAWLGTTLLQNLFPIYEWAREWIEWEEEVGRQTIIKIKRRRRWFQSRGDCCSCMTWIWLQYL